MTQAAAPNPTPDPTLIRFRCPHCQRQFKVPRDLGGKNARCKSCGGTMQIPTHTPQRTAPAVNPHPAASSLSPRQRRLLADERQLRRAFPPEGQRPIRLTKVEGSPPERYELAFTIDSLTHGTNGEPAPRREHRAVVTLPHGYPRMPPVVAMLTPAFHPNIDPSSVCVGDHWAAGERLCDLIVRVGEMLAYQAYNIRSPLDGEAAMWADLNQDRFPTDPADLRALTDGL